LWKIFVSFGRASGLAVLGNARGLQDGEDVREVCMQKMKDLVNRVAITGVARMPSRDVSQRDVVVCLLA
jgi:hypothetical protein